MKAQGTFLLLAVIVSVISIAYWATWGRADKSHNTDDNWWSYNPAFSEPCDDPSDSITIYMPKEGEKASQLRDGVEYDSATAVWDTTVHVDDFVDLIK